MSVFTSVMVFGIIWWLVLFMVLPFGARSPYESGEDVESGFAPSAPIRPRLWLKIGITTVITILLWLVYYYVMTHDLFGFRDYVRG